MSKPFLLCALFFFILAPSARGQDTLIARLKHRADSLLITWRQAQGLADLADSLERERATAGRDTVAFGALRIIANPSPLPLREAAERAWPFIDTLFGNAAAALVDRPYLIRAADPDPAVRRIVLHVGHELPWDLDLRSTTTMLLTNIPMPPLDARLADWLGGPLRPTQRPQEDAAVVYLQLVTAPSTAVRQCFLGDIARCRQVLQLGDTAGLLEQWYSTPQEREWLVTSGFANYFNQRATAAAYGRCAAHRDADCTALLRALPAGTLPRPLAHAARALLLRETLRSGGRDAYRRLAADSTGAVGERIARAGHLPLDSLVVRWRNAVLAARPRALTIPWWAALAAVGWTAVFGYCALRSSRWRL
jgi:hypothetical protein